MIKLAILIPHLTARAELLKRLQLCLNKQINKLENPSEVVMLISEDQGQKKLGTKRNELIAQAIALGALYIEFFDDDDLPGENHIKLVMEGIATSADCCSLWGSIYFSGVKGKPFHHALEHKEWWEDGQFYYRMPNHLNAIKLDLVKDIPFYPQDFGEDGRWSNDIRDARVLNTEFAINEVIYHYFTGRKNTQAEIDHFNKLMAL